MSHLLPLTERPQYRQILTHALRLFAQQGIAATTTNAIAYELGMGIASLYRFFPAKETLVAAVYEEALAQLCAPVPHTDLAALGPSPADRALVQERLRTLWTVSAARAIAAPDAFVFWQEYRHRHQGLRMRETPKGLFLAPVLAYFRRVEQSQESEQEATAVYESPYLALALALGQWTQAVGYVRAHCSPENGPEAAQVLETTFASWWRGLGFD